MERVAWGQRLGDREKQEDAVHVVFQSEKDQNGELLLLLSDGMGGHAGGEVASNLAIETFVHHFQNVSENLRPQGRLEEALLAANHAISDRVQAEPDLAKMGCTLIAVLVAAGRVAWVSVGDSIVYLLRDGQLKKINADHSYFGELLEMVDRGEISLEEAKAHPRKNALRSAVSGDKLTIIDNKVISSKAGDTIVLASDGIETLSEREIARIVYDTIGDGAKAVTQRLLDEVVSRERPKQDNVSLVVLHEPRATSTSQQIDAKWRLKTDQPSRLIPVSIGVAAAAALILMMLALFGGNGDPEPVAVPAVEPAVLPSQDLGSSPIDEGTAIPGSEPEVPDQELTEDANGDTVRQEVTPPAVLPDSAPVSPQARPTDRQTDPVTEPEGETAETEPDVEPDASTGAVQSDGDDAQTDAPTGESEAVEE